MDDLPEFIHKPKKKPNYQERVRLGLQRGGLRPMSKKGQQRRAAEAREHNKNIEEGNVFCVNCGGTNHIEKHHYKGRSFPTEFIYVCGEFGCKFHLWIHQNENEAFRLGYLHPEYRGLKPNPNHPRPWE